MPVVDRVIARLGRPSLRIPRLAGSPLLMHHDMSPEHLIVDAATGDLAGILDWTDAILGDPARDFVALVAWRGWSFAEEVLRRYSLPKTGRSASDCAS